MPYASPSSQTPTTPRTRASSQAPTTPHASSQGPRTPLARVSSEGPRTPLARTSSEGTRTPLAHASSQGAPRSGPALPFSPESNSALSPTLSLLTERTFDIALADTNLSGDVVYQHTRNLRGITGTHSYPCVNTQNTVSCGVQLDTYLQALGYDLDAKLTVAYVCATSQARMENFVREMIKKGLPVLEAKYMWILYTSSLPDSLWAETHVM